MLYSSAHDMYSWRCRRVPLKLYSLGTDEMLHMLRIRSTSTILRTDTCVRFQFWSVPRLRFRAISLNILQFYFRPLAFRYFSFRSHLVTVTMNLVLRSCRPPACDLFCRNISCAKKIKKTWVKKSGSMNEYFKDFVCWKNDRGFHS